MTVVKNAVSIDARYNSRFAQNPPTYGSDQQVHTLQLHLEVNDAAVRQQHDYDGFERPFVMVPREVGGEVTWERHDLQYRGSKQGAWQSTLDSYEAPADVKLDLDAVRKNGIKLGMDTNTGTVELQEPGQSIAVKQDWF